MVSNAAPSFTYFLPLHGFAASAQTQRWREAVPASAPLFTFCGICGRFSVERWKGAKLWVLSGLAYGQPIKYYFL